LQQCCVYILYRVILYFSNIINKNYTQPTKQGYQKRNNTLI